MTINYPTFNDVEDPTLRAWNRLNIIFNIKEHLGNVVATRYTKQFNNKEKAGILALAAGVSARGYENIRREIIRKNNG